MKEEQQAKRAALQELSKIAKMGIAANLWDTVNEGLVEMYKKEGHEEIHSFKKWLSFGKVVKKGEKALLLWGEPRNKKKSEPTEQPGAEENEYKFFPLAYVFSNLQVENLKQHAEAI